MFYSKKLLFVVLLPFLVGISGWAQKSDSSNIVSDSILNQVKVSATLELLKQADSIRLSDSLQKAFLKQQLEELKSNEISKRRRLEAKLNQLHVSDSLKKVHLKQEIDSLKKRATGFPVIPYKDTLFFVYTKVGTITAAERAEVVMKRAKDMYKQFIVGKDSLVVADYGQTVDIVFGDKTVLSINELDAIWFEKSKLDIAYDYQQRLIKDVKIYKSERSLISLLKEIGLVLLVLVILYLLIRLVNKLYRTKAVKKVVSLKDIWFTGLQIKNYQILDADSQIKGVVMVLSVVRYFVIFILLYIAIPIVFSIFPPTERIADTLFGYFIAPVKVIAYSILKYIPNLIAMAVIVFVFRYLIKGMRYLSNEIEQEKLKIPGFFPDWAKPTFNIIRVLLNAFMVVVLFPYLPGSDSDVFKGVSVFLGIVFSLGSSSVIGNMVAGLVLTYMRPFKLKDRIKIGDVVGDVMEKTPFVTRIKTPKNEFITIPNTNVLSSNVINYSTSKLDDGIVLFTTITIGYDVPWRQVHELLIGAAQSTSTILQDPSPFVLQTSLDDFYVSYQLNAHSSRPERQPKIYSELHQNIQDAFNEAGIEIMSPHYRGVRDGNETTIPTEHRSESYRVPSFRFKQDKQE